MSFKQIPTLLSDFYKQSHRIQYPENTELVYSNFTPRSGKYYKGELDKVVFFGLQYFIKNVLIDTFNEEFFNQTLDKVLSDYKRIIKNCLFVENPDTSHIESLHKLGYLPLEVKALDEGSLVNYQIPVLTVVNTLPEFFWLTNYIETAMSADLWMLSNNATLAYEYKQICNKYADITCDNKEHLPFQCHDFSFRGMPGIESATASGMSHLLSFQGTDTVPSIMALEYYYDADVTKELVGCSIAASEHSVMCSGGKEDEYGTYKRFITELYPIGLVSIVSDTWDFFGVLTNILPRLKSDIMSRDGKVVIRPDSGNPSDIICGAYDLIITEEELKIIKNTEGRIFTKEEYKRNNKIYNILSNHIYKDTFTEDSKFVFKDKTGKYYKIYYDNFYGSCSLGDEIAEVEFKGAIELLWETFGGTVNEKGYKVLDPHIGLIYGDSITLERAEEIFKRLEAKGFASSNVLYGVGSFSYCFNTRDSQGWAMKATYVEVNGQGRDIFKQPKTDSGKNSAKGLLRVEKLNNDYILHDQQSWEQEKQSELTTVFKDGVLTKQTTLAEIRQKLS